MMEKAEKKSNGRRVPHALAGEVRRMGVPGSRVQGAGSPASIWALAPWGKATASPELPRK